jgi:hypothetical protein
VTKTMNTTPVVKLSSCRRALLKIIKAKLGDNGCY